MQVRFRFAATVTSVIVIAGCADAPVQPLRSPEVSPLATTTTAGDVDHLVVFRGSGVPQDFAARVAALGGTLRHVIAAGGAATVSGLTDAAVTSLRADAAVQEAAKTLRGITGADVISMSANVEDGKITTYKTTVNIAFGLER